MYKIWSVKNDFQIDINHFQSENNNLLITFLVYEIIYNNINLETQQLIMSSSIGRYYVTSYLLMIEN